MSDIGIITFPKEETAKEVLKSLKKLEKDKLIKLEDAAVITKGDDGKAKISQTLDATKAKGAVSGGAIGMVIGTMVGGPVGGALLGAAAGAFASKKIDYGIPNEKIEAVSEALENHSSAIFVKTTLTEKNRPILRRLMKDAGGTLYELELSDKAEADFNEALTEYSGR
jgi:uncharacterized membrane protein